MGNNLWQDLEQVNGHAIAEVLPDPFAREMAEENRRALEAQGPVESEQVVTVGEVSRTFVTTRIGLSDEKATRVGVCGVAVDITDRKRSEKRLRFLADVASKLVCTRR